MEKDLDKVWEKLSGKKKICSEKLNIEGFTKKIPFDIYDGIAVCEDFGGHSYVMTYPQMKAVKDSEEIAKAIIDYVGGITTADEITVLHILMTFNTLYEDGVEVVPSEAD
jgi:hypothetical protein